uniref:Uncharacterized protein n=1 Tax=Cucumis melo TaxID=3656 RepID=A0A9I9ECU9_CUCME
KHTGYGDGYPHILLLLIEEVAIPRGKPKHQYKVNCEMHQDSWRWCCGYNSSAGGVLMTKCRRGCKYFPTSHQTACVIASDNPLIVLSLLCDLNDFIICFIVSDAKLRRSKKK